MILMIDNYDSFTWNVVHLLQSADVAVKVIRNDSWSVDQIMAFPAKAIVLSPGPCTPKEAGICVPLVTAALEAEKPLLGICLGHQSIAEALGAKIVRAPRLMHGKTSAITHTGAGLFAGLPSPFTATRYHSLIVDPASVTNRMKVIAHSEDDVIMGLEVVDKLVFGLQFHPESIASEHGRTLVQNFLRLTGIKSEENAA